VKYFLSLFLSCLLYHYALSQPGYHFVPLQFKLFSEKGVNDSRFGMQWRNPDYEQNKWNNATLVDGFFQTAKLRSDGQPTTLKIYVKSGFDTMFITCTRSLYRIPFKAGIFQLNENQCYLANMQSMNGAVIINQDWENFRLTNAVEKSILIKKRFFYMQQSDASIIENDIDVLVGGYRSSQHLKVTGYDGVTEYINLGKIYYAPVYSPSVYCIGYLAKDEDGKEKYSEFLMESTDACRSWNIKFPLPDNSVNLVSMTESVFTFHISYPGNQLFSFNHWGKLLDSAIIYDAPCNLAGNVFFTCDGNEVKNNSDDFESSEPFMDQGSFNHIFHNVFSSADGSSQVRIDKLPFSPESLSISNDGGNQWKKILELNSKETYVYLTQRKEKLVLVSYHYTLISNDFGKTWTFYENGTFNGGEWNFIWLDDNTLVNVTPYYADFMEIL
jgi:hypothetical protein